MKFTKSSYTFLFLLLVSLILLFAIFKWITYLTNNKYIVECFTNAQAVLEGPKTSHTVNLPLTTTYSCKNFLSKGQNHRFYIKR